MFWKKNIDNWKKTFDKTFDQLQNAQMQNIFSAPKKKKKRKICGLYAFTPRTGTHTQHTFLYRASDR